MAERKELKPIYPFEPKTLGYSMQELCDLNDAGKIDFEIPQQRGYKWKNVPSNNQQSKLILSLFLNVKISGMICNGKFTNSDDKIFEIVDGQQRLVTVFRFIKGQFTLKNVPPIYMGFDKNNMEIVDLKGKAFKDLPEKLQQKITSYMPEITYYENLTTEQKIYAFVAANNGTSLTKAEKSRVEIKDQGIIVSLAKHHLFDSVLSDVQVGNRENENIIKQIWGALYVQDVGFTDAVLTPMIINTTITQEQQNEIKSVCDKLLQCHEILLQQSKIELDIKVQKSINKFIKKIFKKVHISSVAPVVLKSIYDGISEQELVEWITHFFTTEKGATINTEYNNASMSGSASPQAVKARLTESMNDYQSFINGADTVTQDTKSDIENTPDQLPVVNEVPESAPDTTNNIINETTPEVKEPSQTEQEQPLGQAQISFNEDQAKANEKIYNDKSRSHKKK